MIKYLLALSLLCCAFVSNAHEEHTKHQNVAIAVSVAFDARGNLWKASVHDEFLQVSKSADQGRTFSKPVVVNQIPHKIGADGEARPKIAISSEGYIYLTWTEALKKPFSGYIWFARSIDAGKTFEKPYIVHQDRSEITHRFDSLNVSADGKITVTWVDKRDLLAAKAANQPYEGAAIYYAVSENKGVSFAAEQKLADSSCECCRIALTNKPDGTVTAMWRHVFEGSERDHMMAEIPANQTLPQPTRATFGHWKVDGCPHHGAALASGGEAERWWGYHMAWFDGGNDEAGQNATLFYARMDGVAWVSSPTKKFGNMKKQAGHPALAAIGDTAWLVWREKDAGKSQIWLMKSEDDGKSWAVPSMIAETTGNADYPVLLPKDTQMFLMWNTSTEGLKALAI
ncbi:MAG: sialidase family protein [Methylotenera sp.]|nr:sialidase family protein [Methylotenera sp.]